MSADELSRLVAIANRVWQYIGHDFMADGAEFDNDAAVECCFDADRPLLCSHDPEQAKEDQAFCKQMFAQYGFNTVVTNVAAEVRYI